jgi:hypothetical protein
MSKDKISWADRDVQFHSEIEAHALKFSTEYIKEIKSDSSFNPVIVTRPVKSASADGFRCGLIWVTENPTLFLSILVKSLWRRICRKNTEWQD